MTVVRPTGVALYAALAEQIYRRDNRDQALADGDIFGQGQFAQGGFATQQTGLSLNGDGFYYQEGPDNGFVARVVKVESTYIIVYRGTDLSGSQAELAADQLGFKNSERVDSGDFDSNLALGPGTWDRTQLDDAVALADAVIDRAAQDSSNVIVVGQSLGGGLAGLMAGCDGMIAAIR